MKIYILAQGKGSRWEGENLPSEYKQLVPIGNGEVLINRTIRQVKQILGKTEIDDITLVAPGDFLLYNISPFIHFRSFREPTGCILDGICRTKKEWDGHRIVFLLGDVVYSNRMMKKIINNTDTVSVSFFGRNGANVFTDKEASEIFAFSFSDNKGIQYTIWDAMRLVWFHGKDKNAKLWTLFTFLMDVFSCSVSTTGMRIFPSEISFSSVANDYTDDIDSPEEYNLFYEKLKELALADDERRI